MTISADVQKLFPGQLVELYELDASLIGGQIARFHAHLTAGPIIWKANVYSPWSVTAEGFSRSSNGQQPTPTLKVGNVDGSISSLCLALADMVGAQVTRRRTLAKYLDAANFAGGNPTANPDEEMPPEVWLIERKSHEDNEAVEFELSSPLDFDGEQLPRRQIIPNICAWDYRSAECSYAGPPVADSNDVPTDDPAKDQCSKGLGACKLRFGANNPLPFGGFPAAGLVRS
ncbi:phage minor tail protein L [Paraburkholderia strydomiana]|uniref:phage minor tail protein L n=1 Tax=Paraburkholderia strydomiana TaxID=1245417 RepID=UPI0038B82DAA